MDKSESKTKAGTQGSVTGKPSEHFLNAAVGSANVTQGLLDRHCPDELAFWTSGGYSVNKAVPVIS